MRIDCRILLLAAAHDPGLDGWRVMLEQAGIPFDTCVAGPGRQPLGEELLAVGDRARYQAVILATGGLPRRAGPRFVSSLSPQEWQALAKFERRFAIRRIAGFTYPSARYGLGSPSAAGGQVCGARGALTRAGRAVFGELGESVPLDAAAYGYRCRPLEAGFDTLVEGPDGAPIVGVFTDPDGGREELVCTISLPAHAIHTQLLAPGMLRWVTRGVHLGQRRYYMSVHVDDVLLASGSAGDDRRGDAPAVQRMIPADVTAAAAWSARRDVRLDLAFNGHAAQDDDPLTASLLEHKHSFGWINHTFGHLTLDDADLPTITAEIGRNVEFARERGLTLDPSELVTGEHSGLQNAAMPAALERAGIRWIADDNSRRRAQQRLGSALTVPRHPTKVCFDVASRDDQLRALHTTSWEEFVDAEAGTMLAHLLADDPRPHYLHQSNLSGDRIALGLLDEVIDRFRECLTVGFIQPTLAQAGEELARKAAWRQGLQSGAVSAYLEGGRLHVSTQDALPVPVTGAPDVGSDYGGHPSGWSPTIDPDHGDVVFELA